LRVGPGIEHTFSSDKAVPERRRYIVRLEHAVQLKEKLTTGCLLRQPNLARGRQEADPGDDQADAG
jgi:hypothetical protein